MVKKYVSVDLFSSGNLQPIRWFTQESQSKAISKFDRIEGLFLLLFFYFPGVVMIGGSQRGESWAVKANANWGKKTFDDFVGICWQMDIVLQC